MLLQFFQYINIACEDSEKSHDDEHVCMKVGQAGHGRQSVLLQSQAAQASTAHAEAADSARARELAWLTASRPATHAGDQVEESSGA